MEKTGQEINEEMDAIGDKLASLDSLINPIYHSKTDILTYMTANATIPLSGEMALVTADNIVALVAAVYGIGFIGGRESSHAEPIV